MYNQSRLLLLAVFALTVQFAQAQKQQDKRNCSTMDVYEQQLADNPNLTLIREEIERQTADYIPSPGQRQLVTIPIVFHVIHDGDAVGSGENIADLYIMEQLDQLNDDFRLLNTDAGNVPAEFAPVQADIEVEFCLATQDPDGNATTGIERYDFGQSSWGSSSFNSTVKPGTIWDRNSYCNFWIANLSGGLLGYAQFPGGNASTDGVVCLYSSVGSIDVPFPGGAPYDLGRTGTHEIGHWLNLYHTFQGGCNGGGDQVADTPAVQSSNGGCPNHPSPSCGSNDMFMNYMDYVVDDCMIMFSEGQKTRVESVLIPSGGFRHSLLSSIGCVPLGATVSFATNSTSLIEGTTSCATDGFQDVILDVEVGAAPSVTSVVNISLSGVANTEDYTINPSSLVFPAGSTTTQSVTVTIAEDAYVESDEDIILDLSVVSGDLLLGANPSHIVDIYNDDNAPDNAAILEFLNEDFNSTPTGWTITNGGSNADTWFYTSNGNNNLDGSQFAFIDSDAAGNGSTSLERMFSPVINTVGSNSITLEFDQYFRAYTQAYNEEITVDVFDGSIWQNVYMRDGNNQGSTGSWGSPDHQSIDISAYANANMQLRFTYDGEWDWWWAIDNVTVNGTGPTAIASDINSGGDYMEAELGPNGLVHFYDQASGNVMMTLQNQTSHNYGCTKVEVNTQGASSYLSNAPESIDITDKNFIVTPEFNNPSGSYIITLYYTRNEILGWQNNNSQGSVLSDLFMVKALGAVATAGTLELAVTSPVSYGVDYKFEANYSTGFSGFGLGNEGGPLPVELLDFTARTDEQHIQLDWSTATELNNRGFELERSTQPASGFQVIAWIDGQGTTEVINNYQYLDREVQSGIWYYYRLKQIDFDAAFEYSDIVTAQIEGVSINVFPNPVQEILQVELITTSSFFGQLEVLDVLGTQVLTYPIKADSRDVHQLNLEGLPNGVYFVRLRDEVLVQDAVRFVKRN